MHAYLACSTMPDPCVCIVGVVNNEARPDQSTAGGLLEYAWYACVHRMQLCWCTGMHAALLAN